MAAYNRRATHPTIPCANWLTFWSLSLTCIQRNVIYRLIHLKIPHKDCLYHLLSRPGISPYCSICVVSIDSIDHFFFSCPPRYLVWQEVIREFLWPTLDIAKIRHALCSLDFSEVSYCLNPKLDGDIVLIISLSAIWKLHWQCIFRQQDFVPNAALALIRKEVATYLAQEDDFD
ncbi:hypothetical protein G6F37_008143 [Rhizopus arrhizus]|nr:hypothetical protein G6F38_009772 [Rhizopus arrhizus]KAG1155869.1 hypothetical protein G6F37_008143 [Rhizopus arrhizus]